MGFTKLNREHLTFNEGGRFFTFYWRWTANQWTPRFLRVWVQGFELMAGFGKFRIGKVRKWRE